MARFSNRVAAVLVAVAAVSLACGKKEEGGGGGGTRVGGVEAAFLKAAKDNGIPARFMIATGWLESHLVPQNATANYVSTGGDDQKVARGTLMTQTAFGLTYQALALDPAKDTSSTLEAQIDAYGHWLGEQIKAAGVKLAVDPQTPEEKFYWIETLANLHRAGLNQRQNVRVIFARELINVLNQGFVWQRPDSDEKLELQKERQPINIDAFPANGQSWFSLNELDAQIYTATYLPLVTVPSDEFENKPTHIEVIHCPLTLSACLELQTRSEESDIHLAAHYIIPADDTIFKKVIQVADQKQALILTNNKGDNVPVEDAVVIMLVGNSGRVVGGSRTPAIPTWFSDPQLRALGQVINDVCTLLAKKDQAVNRDQCMSSSGDHSIRFHFQDRSEDYRWGDIADFDQTIFGAYVADPAGVAPDVKFDFARGNQQFRAGQDIPLKVLFNSSVRTVELERLQRCPDGRVVWIPVESSYPRGKTAATFAKSFPDSGPNEDGVQYLRVRVYGQDEKFIGWSIDQVLLSGYEKERTYASEKYCFNGS